ncbi:MULTISPECIES: 4-hydroxy-3-methylbut-2-enyl diphosphate reductase [Sphingobacterium]|jgi:4-hydroxy-3-methylbut-2-en-1-yl diphosphate reductase|uniref:4-hydroxy-3-methylbut-2-enyl diphosphate reductase n=2 Tax=Sphingobacterium TaxID=28453 RepID=A0ACD5BXW3_9SPHI|nr:MULTISPECIES: 4-hydroxy-3-methylbut-2-enyl diphosphate reductase [Sphingobacterium]HAE69302.1 4-hydroxy-3-methylbut-2-enyl diphosphate reductase [Sphingobacterium sp.]MDF2851887.1 4-hydroxy-3-methylbut-2-enyl diphosphate reductase [Sphingobacterium multivorum]OFV20145.1 4-hydroxy-3-methylbut-2-enyl diphosphate reductase [Sphingobacterium sp. HMSC13C05]OJZ10773.1 MAG: 4-hydroxy-3-methylbut-2-enyl diphosphate reductase [Sphingobacterium sp. 40-24]QQT43121.1 4-hydroxy-3-methylbut-2-enyl diphos
MALNLTVDIDKDSGFCFGVVYAIDMAEEILEEEGYLYCLGDIVHNDEEVARLKAKGLRIIDHAALPTLSNEKVLIRAHGEAPETYRVALENNITLIDASCPVVLKLQNRIKTSFDQEEKILIFGKHGHAEVIGLQGQTNNEALVFQDISELDQVELPASFTLYSQTTKSVDKFYAIKDELIRRGYEVKANDTICRQVSNRYEDLGAFARQYDKIVFVSGKKSSNGKVLFEVCQNANPASYFISDPAELDASVFAENDRIGICGATSTPMWLMKDVKASLEAL